MSRTAAAVAISATLAACAGAFLVGRAGVDDTPPSLPPAPVATRAIPAIEPAIVPPPRAALP